MAFFKIESKNRVDIGKKTRVYFTCHPDDFEKYFKKICEDIFRTHDCAIYYTEDMTEIIAEVEKQVDLGRHNLFVVPVTFRLLTTPNRAMDEDIPYAFKEHIPILPIMMESGIDALYSKPDKFGELQYINPFSADSTEIAYEEKLKKYLESVLISDELANRVRAAFDAYIFLSYRKKDRKYANELMRLIHSNPECRDIAVWFDEFLTPGESFRENIERLLEDCGLFALLVTPHLLEKVTDENGEERDNYVVGVELPAARKKYEEKGTDIIAVEMEDTDKEALLSISISDPVNFKDPEFRKRLLEAVSRMAITSNNTPEHNYLIGLAYLDGIDVEVDRERAVELITSAAGADLPEAMIKLFDMYFYGTGIQLDYHKAIFWGEKVVNHYMRVYGQKHRHTLSAQNNLAQAYWKDGKYDKFLKLQKRVCKFYQKIESDPQEILTVLITLAIAYCLNGYYPEAQKLEQELYDLSCDTVGKEHPITLTILNSLAECYRKMGKNQEALDLQTRVYNLRRDILGEDDPSTLNSLNNLAIIYSNLNKHKEALSRQEEVYYRRQKVLGRKHPATAQSLNNWAEIYRISGDCETALCFQKRAYEMRCEILGKTHRDSLESLGNLAQTYFDIQKYPKAIEYQKKVCELCYKFLGEDDIDTLSAFTVLMVFYCKCRPQNKQELLEALRYGELGYSLYRKKYGDNHQETINMSRFVLALHIFLSKEEN